MRPGALIPELMLDEPLGGKWQYSIPDLKALLAKDGFKARALDVFVFGDFKGKKGAEIIKRRIEFAAELGAGTIVLGGGPETEDETARARYCSVLRDVADYAGATKVRLALHIGWKLANAREALRVLKEVNRENVGVCFDTANILFYNEKCDPAKELEAVADRVFYVHLKDIIRGKTQAGHVLPRFGKGEVDFRKVFNVLHAADFYGPFSFEVETFHGVTVSDDITDYQEDLLASIEHIRSLGEFTS